MNVVLQKEIEILVAFEPRTSTKRWVRVDDYEDIDKAKEFAKRLKAENPNEKLRLHKGLFDYEYL